METEPLREFLGPVVVWHFAPVAGASTAGDLIHEHLKHDAGLPSAAATQVGQMGSVELHGVGEGLGDRLEVAVCQQNGYDDTPMLYARAYAWRSSHGIHCRLGRTEPHDTEQSMTSIIQSKPAFC